ncbi:MAG TPA: cupredoxin domain-containing protein [Gaiellaceae bacterium]
MKKLLLPLVCVSVLAAGAAPATSAPTTTKTVQIKHTGFSPASLTIKAGDTVRWVNSDTVNHQVVSNNGTFVSPILGPGKTYSYQFQAAGTYHYHDGLYPARKGTIVVTGPPPAVTIGVSVPIIVYGQTISLSGIVSSKNAGEKVTIYQQPYPQGSFAQMTTVLTTTGGVWNMLVSPAPSILTHYEATWSGLTSVVVGVEVRPRIRLSYQNGVFRTSVQAGVSHAGATVLVQRLSQFEQWVTIKKVKLGGNSRAAFRLRLPKGRSRIRIAMSVNQAGPGYLAGFSPTITVRRR